MKNKVSKRPSFEDIESELGRIKSEDKKKNNIRKIIGFLVVVASMSVLISLTVLPTFEINGHSMSPTLKNGELVVGCRFGKIEKGDIIAFKHNNSTLIKRVIAVEGDVVDIDNEGNVHVNDEIIDEDYLSKKSYGRETNIEFPYQVPVESFFVLGDWREDSIDSRSKSIGSVPKDFVVGKIVFRIWPFSRITINI